MNRARFEGLVDRALRKLPRRFRERMGNIAVVVEDWPDAQTLEEMGIEPPDTLYGLYRGIDITRRDSSYGNVLPDTIHIYQGPIEEDCVDDEDMVDLVREVVEHEVGHYFGLDDETMEGLEQG
jgi:predicted Zn-dependent protease with MMP-like domain